MASTAGSSSGGDDPSSSPLPSCSPLSKAFQSCTLSLTHPKSVTATSSPRSSPAPLSSAGNTATTTAFYRDKSGSAKLYVKLSLSAGPSDQDVMEELYEVARSDLTASCSADDEDEGGDGDGGEKEENGTIKRQASSSNGYQHNLRFECKSSDNDQLIVEGITPLSVKLVDDQMEFHVEIVVRSNVVGPTTTDDADGEEGECRPDVRSTLYVRAVLLSRRVVQEDEGEDANEPWGGRDKTEEDEEDTLLGSDDIALGLMALDLGGGELDCLEDDEEPVATPADPSEQEQYYGTVLTPTPYIPYNVHIVQPLIVSCTSIGGARGAAQGSTLVSLTIQHPNAHDEIVKVTNIALYPGHSRLWVPTEAPQAPPPPPTPIQSPSSGFSSGTGGGSRAASVTACASGSTDEDDDEDEERVEDDQHQRSMLGGTDAVIDMSRQARWGYVSSCVAPTLPLLLRPHESFSTVLQIDAGEGLRSRTFVSPVAVTATVGSAAEECEYDSRSCVVTTDARWTTERVALVPADAFRVDMSLTESRYKVGAPLVISLRVLNLSNEDRNLMLLMAKDEPYSGAHMVRTNQQLQMARAARRASSSSKRTSVSHLHQAAVNTAVVSEVNGYTFGVWGLSGDDDGTTRQNRDHELLAVDAALLLGEVKGQHAIESELRFVPLREGTLDVPNLKLYDKTHGRWYNCSHCLKIVAAAS